jgi:phosphoglycerate dehydrogenase-like enzyme
MPDITALLTTLPATPEHLAKLQAAAPMATIVNKPAKELTPDDLRGIDVIVGNVAPALLAEAPDLRWVQLTSAGADPYAKPGVLPSDVLLTNSVGAYGQAVSEHLAVMVLSLMKKLPLYRDDQRSGIWGEHGTVSSPVGANVLVLGAGDIGSHFARFMGALGSRVVGIRRRIPSDSADPFDELHTMDDLPQLLPRMDVVASFLPSSPQTRGLVNAEFLSQMKPGAILANGGRGDLVVTDDLVEALVNGTLGGAALDVTNPEPLPANHPLWQVPNALITPHVAGFWHLPVTLENVVDVCVQNIGRYVAGKPLANLVQH